MASRWENELKQSGITDEFQSQLLAAGKSDELAADRKQRLVASIGLAVGAPPGSLFDSPSSLGDVGTAGHAAGSSALQAASLQALVAKVVGTTVLGGLSLWGGYSLLAPTPELKSNTEQHLVDPAAQIAPTPKLAADLVHETPVPQLGSIQEAVSEIRDETPTSDSAELTSKGRKHPASDSLARELAMIETGRAELLRNNPNATLMTLGKYRKEFPKGTLLAEATVLRVEALIASGNRKAAIDVGEAFLRRSPNSPYSRRISSLLGGGHETTNKPVDSKK